MMKSCGILDIIYNHVPAYTIVGLLLFVFSCSSDYASDGTIAFSSHREGDWAIYLMSGDGSGVTRLTGRDTFDSTPAFSPDGRRIAFDSVKVSGGLAQIYVVDRNGGNLLKLSDGTANDYWPTWSPDGKLIAFVSQRRGQNIFVMRADGADVKRLTSGLSDSSPAWSPDGRKILYISARFGVFIIRPDGSNERELTGVRAVAGGARYAAWAPDSKMISFVWLGGLYVAKADGSSVKGVDTGGVWVADGPIAWSPNGKMVLFSSNDGMYLVAMEGGEPTRLESTVAGDGAPSWSK